MYKLITINNLVLALIAIGIIICFIAMMASIMHLQRAYMYTIAECEVCESPYLPEVRYLPETIDCEMQLMEGDIIPARIYSPFGEWEMIIPAEVDYQLNYGARIIQCK